MKPIQITSSDFVYPNDHTCAVTREALNEQYVKLSAGAMLMNRKEGYGGPNENLDGFFNIVFRRYCEDGNEIEVRENIVDIVKGGQFEILFKGVPELRAFFNEICDSIESQIKEQ